MKYELMRFYYSAHSKQIVLDLYNMQEGQGVELRFYKAALSQYKKIKLDNYIDIHRITRDMFTLDEWSELYLNSIKKIEENKIKTTDVITHSGY